MTTDGPAPLSLHRIVFRAVVLAACGTLAMGIAAAAGFVAVADDGLRGFGPGTPAACLAETHPLVGVA